MSIASTQTAGRGTPASRYPVAGFRRGMETEDMDLVLENWTEDCVLRPQSSEEVRLVGKPRCRLVIAAVTGNCDGFTYTEEIQADDMIILPFRAKVAGGLDAQAIDFLRINEDGKCTEMFVLARPSFALSLLVSEVAITLGRQSGFFRGALAKAFVWPIVQMSRLAVPVMIRLTERWMERGLRRARKA